MKIERIVFAGSPAFAAVQLQALLDADAPVVGVLSQPDRPAGRGKRMQATDVKQLAESRGLPVATPPGLRRAANRAALESMQPDLIIVAAYGLLLPEAVLKLPRHGCINVHASLLPRWRGAAPVERAIMAGDRETGVCIMQMDAGLDTGPVRHMRSLDIGADTTGGELEAALARLGADMLLEVLAQPEHFAPVPQPTEGVSHAAKLTRADARIDFHRDATDLARQILALNPRRPATVTVDHRDKSSAPMKLRLLRARAKTDNGGADGPTPGYGKERSVAAPGTLLAVDGNGLHIAAGGGVLNVRQLQLVGGKGTVLQGADLHNALAGRLPPGVRLVAGE